MHPETTIVTRRSHNVWCHSFCNMGMGRPHNVWCCSFCGMGKSQSDSMEHGYSNDMDHRFPLSLVLNDIFTRALTDLAHKKHCGSSRTTRGARSYLGHTRPLFIGVRFFAMNSRRH